MNTTDDLLLNLFEAADLYGIALRHPGESFQDYNARLEEAKRRLTHAAIQFAFAHGTAQ